MSDDKKAIMSIEMVGRLVTIHSSFRFVFDNRHRIDQVLGVDLCLGRGTHSLIIQVGKVFDPVEVTAAVLLQLAKRYGINEFELLGSKTDLEVLIAANLLLQESVIRSTAEASEEEKKGLKDYLEKLEDELKDLEREAEELDDEV